MSKDPKILPLPQQWGNKHEKKDKLISLLMQRMLSNKVKPLFYDHQAMGNYFNFRTAINILVNDLGYKSEDVAYEQIGSKEDRMKFSDFGYMTSHIGPPQSAIDAVKEKAVFESLQPYPPDLLPVLRSKAAEIKFGRAREEYFEVIGVEGAQAGIGYTYLAFLNPGDEVIITDPGYFHFAPGLNLSGAVPKRIVLSEKNNYRLDPDEVRKAITTRTKMLVVCDPLNPFGTIQTKDELVEISKICRDHNILIMNNITHGTHQIDINTKHYPLASLHNECEVDHVISISGTSKGYGMAAARLGFMAGHRDLLYGVAVMKMELTKIHTNLLAQHAALAAIQDFEYVKNVENILRRNLKHIVETVEKSDGCSIPVMPKYGFSMIMDVSGTGITAQELTVALYKHKVIVTPADGLGDVGAADYIRINYSSPNIEAFERFRNVLPKAIAEAQNNVYAEPVANYFKKVNTERALRIAEQINERVKSKR